MHCPNCGAEASASQKFCRACGLSLERFAQLLVELLPDVGDKNVARAKLRLRQLESATKLTGYAVGLTAWLAVTTLITLAGVNVMINTGNIGEGVLLLALAAGSLAAEGLLIYYASLHAKASAQQPARPAAPLAETTNKLLPEEQPRIVTSVTEQTTAQLGEKIESRR